MIASKLIDPGHWTGVQANISPFSTISMDCIEEQSPAPESQTTSRILVAELDQSTLHMLNSCLQTTGLDVIHATDGSTAWRLLQTQTLRLVLLDAALPGLCTRTIVRRIRKSPQLAKLPVILLGEPISTADRIEWFKVGVDEYICKPFSIPVLAAQIRAFARRVDGA
jgi:two-component system OmpR family response regulator